MLAKTNAQLIFEIVCHRQGGYTANCLNAEIGTNGSDLAELHDNITAAVRSHFPGGAVPRADSIHLLLFYE